MKKVICITLMLLIVAGMAGCQKSEISPIYDSRGDKHLAEKILTGNSDTEWLPELYEEGMRIQQTFEHDKKPIKLVVDADVQIPSDRMPAAIVKPHRFTQEEADTMIAYLVGDAYFAKLDLYDKEGNLVYKNIPKSTVATNIERLENDIAHYKSFSFPLNNLIENAEEQLAIYKEIYPTAKELNSYPEASRNFSKGEIVERFYASEFEFLHRNQGWPYKIYPEYEETHIVDEIDGYFEKDGMLYHLLIYSDDTGRWSKMELSQPFLRGGASTNLSDKTVAVYEDAVKTAENAVKSIGAYEEGMRLASDGGRIWTMHTADESIFIEFAFVKEINGVQGDNTDYIRFPQRSGDLWNSGWGYERLEIKVENYGLAGIIWENPCEIVEVLAIDTPMLTFEQVMKCFTQTIFLEYGGFVKDEETLGIGSDYIVFEIEYDASEMDSDNLGQWQIDTIALNLVRVQAGGEYLLVPVWSFYGNISWLSKEEEKVEEWILRTDTYKGFSVTRYGTPPLITINAIDGSLIDMKYGY